MDSLFVNSQDQAKVETNTAGKAVVVVACPDPHARLAGVVNVEKWMAISSAKNTKTSSTNDEGEFEVFLPDTGEWVVEVTSDEAVSSHLPVPADEAEDHDLQGTVALHTDASPDSNPSLKTGQVDGAGTTARTAP